MLLMLVVPMLTLLSVCLYRSVSSHPEVSLGLTSSDIPPLSRSHWICPWSLTTLRQGPSFGGKPASVSSVAGVLSPVGRLALGSAGGGAAGSSMAWCRAASHQTALTSGRERYPRRFVCLFCSFLFFSFFLSSMSKVNTEIRHIELKM